MFRVHRSETVVSSSLVVIPIPRMDPSTWTIIIINETRLQYSRFAGGSRLCLIILCISIMIYNLMFVNVRLIVSRVCTVEWKVCITVCATVYARGGCADGGDVTGHRVKGHEHD